MVIGGDYIFSIWNFIGLNISAVATLMYIMITFGEKGKSSPTKTSPKVIPRDEKNISKKDGNYTTTIKRKDAEQKASLRSNEKNSTKV